MWTSDMRHDHFFNSSSYICMALEVTRGILSDINVTFPFLKIDMRHKDPLHTQAPLTPLPPVLPEFYRPFSVGSNPPERQQDRARRPGGSERPGPWWSRGQTLSTAAIIMQMIPNQEGALFPEVPGPSWSPPGPSWAGIP